MGRRAIAPCVVVTAVRLTCAQAAWLRARWVNPSAGFRDLVDAAIRADEADLFDEVSDVPALGHGNGNGRLDDLGAEEHVRNDVPDNGFRGANGLDATQAAHDGMSGGRG